MNTPALILLVAGIALSGVGQLSIARADEVLSPADGAQVSSLPTFAFTFTNGAVDVELSRAAELRTAGENAGAFVDPATTGFYFLLYNRQPRDGLGIADRRLNSGTWFWHERSRNDDLDDSGGMGPWGQVRTFVVDDEPVVLEGWTLRAQRLRSRGSCRRVRLRGRIAWQDNDDRPRVAMSLRVRGSRVVTVRLGTSPYDGAFDRVLCASAGRLRVTPQLTDRGGSLVIGDAKSVP